MMMVMRCAQLVHCGMPCAYPTSDMLSSMAIAMKTARATPETTAWMMWRPEPQAAGARGPHTQEGGFHWGGGGWPG